MNKSFSFFVSPNFGKTNFENGNAANTFLNEKAVTTLSFGGNYQFFLSKKISIRAGLFYNKLKHQLPNTSLTFNRFLTAPYTFETSFGTVAVDVATMKDGFNPPSPVFPTQFTISYNYSQSIYTLNTPIEIGYSFGNKNSWVSVYVGVVPSIIISQNTTVNLLKERTTNTIQFNNLDLKKINFATTMGVQFHPQIFKTWQLNIEPNFLFGLKNISNQTAINNSKQCFRFNIGLKKKINN